MKTNLLFFRKLFFLVSIFYFASLHAFGQSHASLIMDNCAVVANNEIQFDVSVLNDGSTSLNFNSIVIRFTHNAGITSGGTVSWGMVAGSSSLPNFGTGGGTFAYNSSTHLTNFSSGSAIYTSSTAPALPYGVPVKIGRYFLKVTGGVFNVGAAIGLSWHSLAGIVVWEGNNTVTSSMQTSSNKLTHVPPCSIVIPNFVNCSSSLIATTTDVSAICATDGTATINLDPLPQSIGGTYSLDGGSPINYTSQPIQITGLAAGPHQIVVNNSTCSALSASFNVGGQGSTPYSISNPVATQCDTNLSITLINAPANTSGTYSINGGQALPFSSNPFIISTNNLGYFTLGVNPICVQSSVKAILVNPNYLITNSITSSSNCSPTGSVEINFQNGTTTNSGQYRINAGPWINYSTLPFTINSLPGGVNTIEVIPLGCVHLYSKTITVPVSNAHSLQISSTGTCPNSYNGTATINYVPFNPNTTGTYQLDGGSVINFAMLPIQLTGLSLGTHTIVVNNVCPSTLTSVFTIDTLLNPLVFQNIVGSCSAVPNGSVSINFTNSPMFTSGNYSVDNGPWEPFSSIPFTISNLSLGQKVITIQNTCPISSGSVTIPNSVQNVYLSFSNITNPTCYGASDGSVMVNLIGNSAINSGNYQLDGGTLTPFSSMPFVINGLSAGAHIITLENVCLNAPNYNFNLVSPIQQINNIYETACQSFTWQISGNSYTTSGNYSFNSTDSNGCIILNKLFLTINNGTLGNSVILPSTSLNLCANNLQTTGNKLYGAPNCELIAEVNSNSNLGFTQVCVNFLTNPTWNAEPYANRVYSINPSIQPVGGATVKLYYSASDLASAGISNNSQISITKVGGNGLLGGSGAVEEITNSMMTITNLSNGYKEVSFPVTSFSTFYLHSKNNGNAVLPVTYVNFSGRKMGANDLIEWSTANEENNRYFNLQYSTDAINFKTIEKVESKCVAGIESLLDYSFTHTATANGHNYYRLE